MHEMKRRYPRYAFDRPLIAHRIYDEMTVSIRGRCQMFGQGGAGAQMSEQLLCGEVISLELSPTLKVYAAVRYTRAFFHGFEFVLLKDRQKAELARISRELAERSASGNASSQVQ